MNIKKKIATLAVATSVAMSMAPLALAATPDGAVGPWADAALFASQGFRKDGSPVPALRSDITQALGVAETSGLGDDVGLVDGTFYSLGFGGVIYLEFQNGVMNGPGDDLQVYEGTNPGYPLEKAEVAASNDGITWTPVGTVTRDGTVDLGGFTCVQKIRITDMSDVSLFEQTADAYDLDAVQALHSDPNGCPPIPGTGYSCHTFEFDDATFYKLWPNKRPGGTVNLPGNLPANVNGHSNPVNIALNNATKFNASDREKAVGWYLSLQMSMYRNGGAGSGPVLEILNSPMSCWSNWNNAAYAFSAGIVDQNTSFKDMLAIVKATLDNNTAVDYTTVSTMLNQLSQNPY